MKRCRDGFDGQMFHMYRYVRCTDTNPMRNENNDGTKPIAYMERELIAYVRSLPV